MKKRLLTHFFVATFVVGAWFVVSAPDAQAKKTAKNSTEEIQLAKVPYHRFSDWRLKKIYRSLGKKYRLLYAHASYDGFILPDERRDLLFERRILHRLRVIDKRYKKINKEYRKHKRHYRRQKRRRRLTKEDKYKRKVLAGYKKRYERMIRRFACRYLKRYKRRYRKHCKRT